MVEVKNEGILLEKTQLEFENEGVLNPAVIRTGDNVHLFYRAVRKGNQNLDENIVFNPIKTSLPIVLSKIRLGIKRRS